MNVLVLVAAPEWRNSTFGRNRSYALGVAAYSGARRKPGEACMLSVKQSKRY